MRRPYRELRDPVEQRGGSMVHVRKGYQWGAWLVSLNGKSRTFQSNGRGYPELDQLYQPNIPNPTHYRDYSNTLVRGTVDALIVMPS